MTVKYRDLKTAKGDVFKKIAKKDNSNVDYNSFIDSLKNTDIQNINIVDEITKAIKKVDVTDDVKQEITKRLEEKYGIRKGN